MLVGNKCMMPNDWWSGRVNQILVFVESGYFKRGNSLTIQVVNTNIEQKQSGKNRLSQYPNLKNILWDFCRIEFGTSG